MSQLTDVLDNAVGPVRAAFTTGDIAARAARRRRTARVRRALAAAVIVALIGGGVLLLVNDAGGRPRVTTPITTPSGRGVFPDRTGSVLALDDGLDGITLVDLDHRVAVRRVIDGQRAGDQPFRLRRVGDSLIVGWDDVYAAPLADGGPSKLLGHATYSVPAVEPGAVWLIDYSGGRIGLGTSTFREVDLSGRVLVEGPGPDASLGYPAIGVPGGVALETDNGIALWQANAQKITGRDGTGHTFISDSLGSRIVWCSDLCATLAIHEFGGTPPFVTIAVPPAMNVFDARNARFSPDSRLVAASGGGKIAVFDARTGARVALVTTRIADADGPPALVWSADGRRLFFTSDSYMKNTTTVGEYVIATGKSHVATLPFGGALRGTALSRSDARAMLRSPASTRTACVAPTIQPSGRTACGFRF